jgi:hypothetical protein
VIARFDADVAARMGIEFDLPRRFAARLFVDPLRNVIGECEYMIPRPPPRGESGFCAYGRHLVFQSVRVDPQSSLRVALALVAAIGCSPGNA